MKILKREMTSTSFTLGQRNPTTGNFLPGRENIIDEFLSQNDWVIVGNELGDDKVLGQESFIDLRGLSQEDKTIFFDNVMVQTPLLPIAGARGTSGDGAGPYDETNAPAGATLSVTDLMTSIPIDIQTAHTDGHAAGYAGFPELSTLNFEHVIYNRTQSFALDLDFGGAVMQLTGSNQTGSGQATASDRIYCYRFVTWTNDMRNVNIVIPPARHLCAVTAKEEPMVSHLYRLKRSYDLQQSFDIDRL